MLQWTIWTCSCCQFATIALERDEPLAQNPFLKLPHSFTLIPSVTCRYIHSSPLLQKPYLAKNQHSDIFLKLYSCMNSQFHPFLHKPLSQCLHTVRPWAEAGTPAGGRKLREEGVECRRGQLEPRGQPWGERNGRQRVTSGSSLRFNVCFT